MIRAVAFLAALAAAPVWPAPPNPMQLTRKAGLTPETHEFVFLHVHSHLDVFVKGKKVVVPAGIGIDVHNPAVHTFPAPDGPEGPSNRLHIESFSRRGTPRPPDGTGHFRCRGSASAKSFGISGEPGGNRTPNPQIKSLLLCQLSYRPTSVGCWDRRTNRRQRNIRF